MVPSCSLSTLVLAGGFDFGCDSYSYEPQEGLGSSHIDPPLTALW